MRHQLGHRRLGRNSGHRAALFRNQLSSMIEHERIITTLIKAKELRPIVEKMVTLAKTDDVHHRRLAARRVAEKTLVQKLFNDISPRFTERPGGYTRIIKLGPRRGDGAEMAILEFVDYGEKATTANAAPAATQGDAAATESKPKRSRKAAETSDEA